MDSNKRLVIVGAGGFGREVHAWAADCRRSDHGVVWSECAFLDNNSHALDDFPIESPVIGSCDTYTPNDQDLLVCAIGDPRAKLAVCRSLQQRGAQFYTLVHPTAVVGERSRLGVGVVLCPHSVVTVDVHLGDFTMLNVAARVGHDATLGPGCTLSGGCDVTGGGRLGEGVFLGANATMLPSARAGDYAKIAAGSVVYRRAPAGATVSGSPAKRLPDLAA